MADRALGPVVGIVLAAGASTRLGRPKQLLDLAGQPVIVHVVARALAAGLEDVLVVTGGAGESVATALAGMPVQIVPNHAYLEGQSTSLIAGLDAIPTGTDAAIVLLGDQPGIDPADITALVARRRSPDRPPIVMTQYGDVRSHPVLFGHEVFSQLTGITGDQGARNVIRAHGSDVEIVPSALPSPPLDLDTEAAYQQLLQSWPGT